MTDFRALCAELIAGIDEFATVCDTGEPFYQLIDRARAALDEPEGEGPDHASLITFAYGREPWATWLKIGGCLESAHCELSDLMTDVLARWGRPAAPAPKPIPVSERLPEDTDHGTSTLILLQVGASCGGGAHLTPDQCHCILTLLATPLAGP